MELSRVLLLGMPRNSWEKQANRELLEDSPAGMPGWGTDSDIYRTTADGEYNWCHYSGKGELRLNLVTHL